MYLCIYRSSYAVLVVYVHTYFADCLLWKYVFMKSVFVNSCLFYLFSNLKTVY